MKSKRGRQRRPGVMSHPARGAWIEIRNGRQQRISLRCRTPQGVRGLKYKKMLRQKTVEVVAPRKGCVD